MEEDSNNEQILNEYEGAGSAKRIWEWHSKQALDESGNSVVIIKPEPKDDPKKKR